MIFENLIVGPSDFNDRVLEITINRPHRRNAVDVKTAKELLEAWRYFNGSSYKVAVVSGSGDQAFSSGADLDSPPKGIPSLPSAVGVTKPVIAAVQGWCIGYGVILSQLADITIADQTARFYMPEAKIGKTGGSVFALVPRVPAKTAMGLLLGEIYDSDQALAAGLVNHSVPREGFGDKVAEIAGRIAEYDSETIQWMKQSVALMTAKSPGEWAEYVSEYMDRVTG